MMQILFDMMRWGHIFGGFLTLFIFWIPIITKKGGGIHTRIGWLYVWAMVIVSFSAFFMGVYRLTWDAGTDPDAIPFSWFLLFIAILSSTTAWHGVRVLHYKKRKEVHRQFMDLVFPGLLLGMGIGISLYGWIIGLPLLKYFPLIGLFIGGSQLVYWLTVPKTNSHWIVEHIVGMLSCCIATVTAFTVFGAPRLLQVESVSLIIWILPTMLFVPIIVGFTIVYKKKMDHRNISQ